MVAVAVVIAPDAVQKASVGDMSAQHLERGAAVQVDLEGKARGAVGDMEGTPHEEYSTEHEGKKDGNTADEGTERAPVVEAELAAE